MVRLDESCENFGKDNGLIHEAVVTGRKVGAGQNFWAKLAHDEELFEKVVALVAGNGIIASISAVIVNYKPTPSQIRAREIMGKNYLGIEEVVRQFGAAYTEEQLALLAEIPFSEVVLEKCKDTHILVAGFPMTILDVRAKAPNKKPKTFYSYKDAWYNNQSFAKDEKLEVRWYLIRKEAVVGSTSKNFDDQKALLSECEEVPRACELVYAVVLYFLVTGERLFPNLYVRTMSLDSDGIRVVVGYFGSDGLFVGSFWDDVRYVLLGVASARKSE